jgi:hypothetical protein
LILIPIDFVLQRRNPNNFWGFSAKGRDEQNL